MSELRPWSEEDATAEELSLLAVARRRRALPSQRAAVLSALGVGITATSAAGAAGITGVGTKLVGLALLASVGVGVGLWVWHPSEGYVAPAAAPSILAPAPGTSTEIAAASPEPNVPAPAPVEAPSKVVRPRPASAPSSSLSRELGVLKQAHDALARGNPNGALSALDDYHARFPGGALGAEETVIRVQALLARGDRAQATAIAHQFSKAHPDSLYARRVEQLVSGLR